MCVDYRQKGAKPVHNVAILLFDGVPTFELSCAIEVFALPRPEYDNWYSTEVVSFNQGPVRGTGGITISGNHVDDLNKYHTLIIPGWPVEQRSIRLDMAQSIVDFAHAGKRIVSFCSGAFLLASLGLLEGRRATTHWRYAEIFRKRFPAVAYTGDVLFTLEDNIGCSAGSAAALDLSLELVRNDFGSEMANQVARRLVIAAHRQGGQAQFVESPVIQPQQSMSPVQDWVLAHLDQPITIDEMAARANMSRRSFDRHFRANTGVSAKSWLNQQRVNAARQLLEDNASSMEQVAASVGFDNAITMRFNFNKYLGISPTVYQQQFCQPGADNSALAAQAAQE